MLSLSDPSLIPTSFLNEIKHDEIYATILEELQKKFAQHLAPNHSHEEKPLSPHLFALHGSNDGDENDDDDLSMTDDLVSSASSEPNDLPADDEYDTDIEQGQSVCFHSYLPFHCFLDFAPSETHDTTGRTQYYGSCEAAKLVPCSYFMAHIEDSEMILRYHQFNTQDIRTITKALCVGVDLPLCYLRWFFLRCSRTIFISNVYTWMETIFKNKLRSTSHSCFVAMILSLISSVEGDDGWWTTMKSYFILVRGR